MNVRHAWRLWLLTASVVMGTGCSRGESVAPPAPQGGPADVQAGVQVLTRGPVHEAFAETVTFDPDAGIVVAKAPPAAIEEVPPDQRPEGENVAWIPGYWAWDDERSDFLWASGIWRALPPGRQWVPGYWGKTDQGFQWASGYWADAQATEVEYLPEPPATVEAGPNIAAPSADQIWIPGCWVRYQGRYAWRPGYWAAAQQDWVWVPAHYVWARRGYVYVGGYWDYSIGRRGVLFAPVYFDAGVYARQGFYYSPSIVIDLGVFADCLFLRPSYGHYYFGDYYAASYSDAGYYAPYSYYSGRHGYDPIYTHQRWEHRADRDWDRRVETDFRHRRDHEDARPPRTLAAQRRLITSEVRSETPRHVIAVPLAQVATRKDSPTRFRPVAKEERQVLGQHGQEVRKFREERQKVETRALDTPEAPAGKPPKVLEPPKVRLPRSPIVAKPAPELDKHQAPPETPRAPTPDPKVEPRPRPTRGRPDSPKSEPKVKTPEPAPEPPKAKREPKVKTPEPAPEPPKGKSKEETEGESKGKSKEETEGEPKGKSRH